MSLDVVRGYFREYYSSSKLSPPRDMEKREFGFLAFGKNIMLRHRTFRDLNELRGFIVRRVPAHVYHSAAYYTHPSEDMGGKGWVGASLIFDIDADHLPTPCKEAHDSWICESCGRGGKGKGPGTCECGGRIREDVWFCEECLEAAKAEVIKLLAILFDDFGLAPGKVRVYFSGHRGFHVHVDDEELGGLDQLQRKEIVDYLTATGLKIDKIISEVETGAGKLIFGPSTGDPGWRGRLARGVYDFLIGATEERMGKTGLGLETIRKLIKNRESMAEPSDIPWNLKGLGLQSWRKIAMSALENERVRIDTVVTTDISRLIRMPTTLHGKTGLKVVEIAPNRLEGFNPLIEGVAFSRGSLSVLVRKSPRFMIGGEELGPYRNQKVELPLAAAILLLCKNLAEVV